MKRSLLQSDPRAELQAAWLAWQEALQDAWRREHAKEPEQ